MVTAPKIFHCKFLPKECVTKISLFHQILCNYPNKIIEVLCVQSRCHRSSILLIWCVIHQSFQGVKRSWSGVNGVQSHVTQIFATKKGQFWIFFLSWKQFSTTVSFRLMIFPESYNFKGSFEVFWTPLRASFVPSDLSLGCGIDLTPSSETLSYVRFGQTDNIK